jgi:hypothetical protein
MHGKHLPNARSGHRIVHNQGQIYSFGGYNPDLTQDTDAVGNSDDNNWENPLFKEVNDNLSARNAFQQFRSIILVALHASISDLF